MEVDKGDLGSAKGPIEWAVVRPHRAEKGITAGGVVSTEKVPNPLEMWVGPVEMEVQGIVFLRTSLGVIRNESAQCHLDPWRSVPGVVGLGLASLQAF